MRRAIAILGLAVASLIGVLAISAQAAVTPEPAWGIRSLAVPTNFTAGDETGADFYEVTIYNKGGAATDGSPLTIVDTLPAGLTVKELELPLRTEGDLLDKSAALCTTETSGEAQTVTCTIPSTLPGSEPAVLAPSEAIRLLIRVAVPPSADGLLENHAEVEGGGAEPAEVTATNPVSETPASSGFEEFLSQLLEADGTPATQAASHPYQLILNFALNTKATPPGTKAPFVPADGDVKDVDIDLPPGLVGNPTAVEQCTAQQFNTSHTVLIGGGVYTANNCPDGSVVGLAVVQQIEGEGGVLPVPIYNLVAPKGMPAQFGFQVLTAPIYINTRLRTGSDYGITTYVTNTTESKRVTAFSATIWGTPWDPVHDPQRGECLNQLKYFPFANGSCPAAEPQEVEAAKAFLRLPTSCESELPVTMSFNTWSNKGSFASKTSTSPAPVGCEDVPFAPTLNAHPTNSVADSPSGLEANLHIPQPQDPDGLGSADLKKAEVTLPPGLVVNPSGANGLGSCSPAEVDLHGAGPARCPDASKIGSAVVSTPLVDHPLPGAVYVATPRDNPFGSLLAVYLVVDDPQSGVIVKLAGKVDADPVTGQLTTTFDDSPQAPVEDFTLTFFGGPRAALRTPALCGTYTTTAQLTSHAAPTGPAVPSKESWSIDSGPGGAPCATSEAQLPNSPTFEAGTASPRAAAFSPMIINLRRADGSQEFSALKVTPPPGLLARLAGVPYCPEAALAAAAAKSGKGEEQDPSCPAASQVGTVTVGAGAGPEPFYTQGRAYLTGPYKGAPVSLAIITPATAGPYDLGTVVVRTALRIDPETAKVTAESDPLPRILEGIPLDVRSIAVKIDRPDFTLNPTNCNPFAFGGELLSVAGQSAPLSAPFQAGGCAKLKFSPKLSLKLTGPTRRSGHPALRAVLTMPKGHANIAKVSVALPQSEWLDQGSLNTICTRVQFAAHACPKGSVYGRVKATSPLVDRPLTGPVYLRSSDNELPDLVAVVRGPEDQPIEIASAGRIDSVHRGIRTTFESFPDAPITKVVLSMRGGKKKGLIENSRDICKRPGKATIRFTAQNGRTKNFRTELKATCGKKGKKHSSR